MSHSPWKRWTAQASRWLHIYLSMVSFAIVFFFAVTGLTLNHPDWFGAGQSGSTTVRGTMPVEWMTAPAKLEIAEALRARHGVRGALSDFRIERDQCGVSFKGPGYTADAFVERSTGRYELTVTTMGAVAILNDLHKGRDTGRIWSLVIDVSAVLLVLVSLTGMVLLWFVHRRRWSGYAVAAAGLLACLALCAWAIE